MRLTFHKAMPVLASAMLHACGGTGTTPAPTPTPTPSVTTSPSPTPAATPTASGALASADALLGGARVGESLSGQIMCDGKVQLDTAGALVNVSEVGLPHGYDDGLQIFVHAIDVLDIELERFPFGRLERSPREEPAIVRYGRPDSELQLPRDNRQLEFSTLGQWVMFDELCYVALAPVSTTPPPSGGQTGYFGLADGFMVDTAGARHRLFGSTAFLDFISGTTYRFTLNLRGVTPFADVSGQPQVTLGTLTATVEYLPASGAFVLADPSGGADQILLRGRLTGSLHLAALFDFYVVEAGGRTYFGTIALDGAQI
jgi:hypothetical protein